MNVTKKNVSTACIACQRRKVKCVGNPCAYCLKKNYVCEFKEAKKRGPKAIKLPTELQRFDLLNRVQESMGAVCMQQNFVEFYFQFIGLAVPKAYKNTMLSPSKINTELRTQVYIITASIMKLYGNTDLETQFITKAHRSSSLFDNDTLESSISLMMMSVYLGPENPKSVNLIKMALSTLKLPSVRNSNLAEDTRVACQSLSIVYDPSQSKLQRATYILDGLLKVNLTELSKSICGVDLLTVGIARAENLVYIRGGFDTTKVTDFLSSVSSSVINEDDRIFILNELETFEALVKTKSDLNASLRDYGLFAVQHYKFLVEWRSGNGGRAYQAAADAIQKFKANAHVVALRFTNIVNLLAIPFYFRQCGTPETASHCVQCFEDAYEKMNKKEQVRRLWEEMCGNLQSYNILRLETELLGNPDTSDSSPQSNDSDDYLFTPCELSPIDFGDFAPFPAYV